MSLYKPGLHYDMIYTYIFNRNWVDTWWQQYSTHLHIKNTQNTENGAYITIKKLNIHNNKKKFASQERLVLYFNT
jgi:hypothetical protein